MEWTVEVGFKKYQYCFFSFAKSKHYCAHLIQGSPEMLIAWVLSSDPGATQEWSAVLIGHQQDPRTAGAGSLGVSGAE